MKKISQFVKKREHVSNVFNVWKEKHKRKKEKTWNLEFIPLYKRKIKRKKDKKKIAKKAECLSN